jgi:hypothetical protein
MLTAPLIISPERVTYYLRKCHESLHAMRGEEEKMTDYLYGLQSIEPRSSTTRKVQSGSERRRERARRIVSKRPRVSDRGPDVCSDEEGCGEGERQRERL